MIYIAFAAYNEEKVMPRFLENIRTEMEKAGLPYKVIGCTDASTDSTAAIIASYKDRMPVECLPERSERGLGAAFRHTMYALCDMAEEEDIVIFLDADCTHDLCYAPRMIAEIRQGKDVVIASRFAEGSRITGFPLHRQLLSLGASIFFRLLFPIPGVKDYTSGYRAYRISMLKKAKAHYGEQFLTETDFSCMAEMIVKLGKLGARCAEVGFTYSYGDKIGESKMRIGRLVLTTFKMGARLLLRGK